jgi:hypothetical protein
VTKVAFVPPPGGAPTPPGARLSGPWGVAGAPADAPLRPAPDESLPRDPAVIFGPPVAPPPPFAGVIREPLEPGAEAAPPGAGVIREPLEPGAEAAPPGVTFRDLPKYDARVDVDDINAFVKDIVARSEGTSPIAYMQAIAFQFLAESRKLQLEEHGGRLKNGAAANAAISARIFKEIAALQKTEKVDVNLRGGHGTHEELLRNLLSIPALQQ